LHKSSTRKELGLFIVEGRKEISFALESGYKAHSFYSSEESPDWPAEAEHYTLSPMAYQKISYRDNESNNLLAVFYDPKRTLGDVKLGAKAFLIVVESLEKPGNLGAIARIADGCGADAVIVAGNNVDIYNPNVIRASVGTVFSKTVVAATNEEILEFGKTHNLTFFAAALKPDAKNYTDCDFNQPLGLVLGSEANGLSDFWIGRATPVVVPMKGRNDSLNVASATAVLAYEVIRQRS
jgi:RNA methyltransferase, TrmH family